MFVIRNEQMMALAAARRWAFEDRIILRLQEIYAGDEPELLAKEALAPRVRGIVDRALSHGIDEEADVLAFVEIAFEVGDDFDTDPANEWAVEILNESMLNPHEKVVAMQSLLEEAAAEDAVTGVDEEPQGHQVGESSDGLDGGR
jgi:hypothetical protein